MRLTLEDVGRLAGVSRSTVSRVVNGETNVRPEVRASVEEVIRQTGYTPHAAARSLVSNRTGVIGLVIPSRVHSLFEDPYFAKLIQGITLASNRRGITLSLFLFESEDEEKEVLPRVVERGFLDGVIVTAARAGDPLITRIAASQMPLVMIGRPGVDNVSYADVDNRAGAALAAQHLLDIGCQRIAFLGAPNSTTTGQDRMAGFIEGLAESGHALTPRLRFEGDFSEASGYAGMMALAEQNPDGIFIASDSMALGAMDALRDLGRRIPDDIAVIGFDGFAASEKTSPPLTTLRQPVTDTASAAVDILARMLSGDETGFVADVLPVELIIRESTGGISEG